MSENEYALVSHPKPPHRKIIGRLLLIGEIKEKGDFFASWFDWELVDADQVRSVVKEGEVVVRPRAT